MHTASRGTYGSPRVHADRHAAGLRGCRGRRRILRTTVTDRAAAPAPDRVARACAPAQVGAPDRRWLAASSYVATHEGRLYLAVAREAFRRRVVGWSMAGHRRAALVTDALAMALAKRQPGAGRIHHADRGGQYTARAVGAALREAGILPSRGAVGDCYDNAVAERFFATRKVEPLHRQPWPTRAAAQLAIFAFIAVWYNRRRRHSTLGYRRPLEHEEVYRQTAAA